MLFTMHIYHNLFTIPYLPCQCYLAIFAVLCLPYHLYPTSFTITEQVICCEFAQDTAGSERYESMSRIYYRGAKAAIVCYDLTDMRSYERAVQWTKEVRELEEVLINSLMFSCSSRG